MSAEKTGLTEADGCCPPTRVPKLEKSATGKGSMENLMSKVDVYTTGDPTSKRVIIAIHDIHGPDSGRHKPICDYFAENGYFVVLPDMFKGMRAGSGKLSMIWLLMQTSKKSINQIMDATYKKYVGEHVESVMMAGFCFGAWVIMHESKRNVLPGKFKFAANFHPSPQVEFLKMGSPEKLARSIQHPMLLVPTEGDPEICGPDSFLAKDPYNCIVLDYSKTQKHAFISQGDAENDPAIKKDVDFVLEEAVKLFNKYSDATI